MARGSGVRREILNRPSNGMEPSRSARWVNELSMQATLQASEIAYIRTPIGVIGSRDGLGRRLWEDTNRQLYLLHCVWVACVFE